MAHAIWSGAINFGLVTIPVKLFTAVKTDELSFNLAARKGRGTHQVRARLQRGRQAGAVGRDRQRVRVRKGPVRHAHRRGFQESQSRGDAVGRHPRVRRTRQDQPDVLRQAVLSRTDQTGAPRLRAAARGARAQQSRRDRARRHAYERVHRRREADRRRARARTHALGERDRRARHARDSQPRNAARERDEDGQACSSTR